MTEVSPVRFTVTTLHQRSVTIFPKIARARIYGIPISPKVLFAEVSQRERRVELVLRVMALLGQKPIGIQDHHLIERPALQEGGFDSSPRCSLIRH